MPFRPLLLFGLLLALMLPAVSQAKPRLRAHQAQPSRTQICHATGSASHPWVQLEISVQGLHGHGRRHGDQPLNQGLCGPGTDPGTDPGGDPGTDPGTPPGADPGSDPRSGGTITPPGDQNVPISPRPRANARLVGPGGCRVGRVRFWVRGSSIQRVSARLNGHRLGVRKFTRGYRIDVRLRRVRVQRVRFLVVFTTGEQQRFLRTILCAVPRPDPNTLTG